MEDKNLYDYETINEYQKNHNENPKKIGKMAIVSIIIISALIGGIIASYIMPVFIFGKLLPYPNNYYSNDTKSIIEVEKINSEFLVSAIAKKAMPSVVGITTEVVQRDFFRGERVTEGVGTGVILDSRGYILTNSHVVNNGDAKKVNVFVNDGQKDTANILWNDRVLDLALLKVNNIKNLVPADLGDSDNLEVGEVAVAIGNPLGLQFERTVTSGIISGLERRIDINEYESIEGLIQTDASINEGNSGGPLLNSKGEVIGINTAKIKSAEGLGFAVPMNVAKGIINQVIQTGEYKKVYMGIQAMEVNRFERYIGVDLKIKEGVYVIEIIKNSPASKGGLRPGDIITYIEDKKITSMNDISRLLYEYSPKDKIKVKYLRNGEEETIEITLLSSPKGYYIKK